MASNSGFWQWYRMLATEFTPTLGRETGFLRQKGQLSPLLCVQNPILSFNSDTEKKSLLNPVCVLNPDLHWPFVWKRKYIIFSHKWFTSLVNSDQVNSLNIGHEQYLPEWSKVLGYREKDRKKILWRRSKSSQLQVRNHKGSERNIKLDHTENTTQGSLICAGDGAKIKPNPCLSSPGGMYK